MLLLFSLGLVFLILFVILKVIGWIIRSTIRLIFVAPLLAIIFFAAALLLLL